MALAWSRGVASSLVLVAFAAPGPHLAAGAAPIHRARVAQRARPHTPRPSDNQQVERLRQKHRGGSEAAGTGAVRATPAAGASVAARQAWGFYQQGNLEAAAGAFARAVRSRHVQPWVRYAYGLTAYGLSRFNKAVQQWEQVRRAVPAFEPVYLDLADGYLRAGRRHKALKMLHVTAKRWPHDPQVFDAMGVAQVQMNKLDDAERSFKHALAAAPNDGLAYFNLGKVYELRYVRARGFRLVIGKDVKPTKDRYRLAAIAAFTRYLKIGGPFVPEAQDELVRLEYQGIKQQPR